MDVRFCEGRDHRREAHMRAVDLIYTVLARSSEARVGEVCFSLDFRLTWMSATVCPLLSLRSGSRLVVTY